MTFYAYLHESIDLATIRASNESTDNLDSFMQHQLITLLRAQFVIGIFKLNQQDYLTRPFYMSVDRLFSNVAYVAYNGHYMNIRRTDGTHTQIVKSNVGHVNWIACKWRASKHKNNQ